MSGETVLVDPALLKRLATAVEGVNSALEAAIPTITTAFANWGVHVDLGPLQRMAATMPGAAHDMRDRADYAISADQGVMPLLTNALSPAPPGMVQIDFTIDAADLRVEAGNDATDLKTAMAAQPPDKDTVRRVAADAADHTDDPAFLQTFYAQAGPQVAGMAAFMNSLHKNSVPPLSAGDEAVLGELARGLAAASRLPGFDATPYTHPGDGNLWSSAMLAKVGPPGDQWGSTFLAGLGSAVLRWQADQKRPGYTPSGVDAAGYIPSAWIGSKGTWYAALGLNPDYISQNTTTQQSEIDAMRAYDPSFAVLDKVAQNPAAATTLAGDPTDATLLVTANWNMQGSGVDDSGHAAAVIRAGTIPATGPASAAQARAAAMIIAATGGYYKNYGGDPDKTGDLDIGTTLRRTLGAVGVAYLPGLAQSTGQGYTGSFGDTAYAGSQSVLGTNQPNNTYADVAGFLSVLHGDPRVWGTFTGSMDGYISTATTARLADRTTQGPDLLNDAGALKGAAQLVDANARYSAGQQKDEALAHQQAMLDLTTGLIGSAFIPEGVEAGNATANGVEVAKILLEQGTAVADGNLTDQQDNATTAMYTGQGDTNVIDKSYFQVPATQAMIKLGRVAPPPSGSSFYRDGVIVTDTPAEQAAFVAWYSQHSEQIDPTVLKLRAGFQLVTTGPAYSLQQLGIG